MGIGSKSRLELELKKIKKDILSTKEQLKKVEKDIVDLKRKERIAKMLRAGKICEDAGILDEFVENNLYLCLVMYRDYVCNKKSLGEISSSLLNGKNRKDEER